ncbi:unnamed protein product [Adineta steineri]|uniref:EGF-like domain-containing protein n=2 Tax=Adineta steineri TaxID=433720 RepID=A0A814X5F8_9BILA|nr:unnamed protein product [Adineta steineri]
MMLTIQWILVVLSFVHIHAADECGAPADFVMCDYIQCANGRCVEDKASSECFKCECSVGYTGQLCEIAVDLANLCNPGCQNGGQCQQTAQNTHICVCPPDYTGSRCETSILATHPCITMPTTVCQNGATCTKHDADYLCNCAAGWSGRNCQIQDTIATCNPSPCGAHGTCLQAVLPNGPIIICNCEAQWTGKFCDVNLAATTTTTTTMTTATMTTPLFTTATISTLVPITGSCTPTSCQNGGTCHTLGTQFICVCNSQWSGPVCNVQNFITPTMTTMTTTYTTTTTTISTLVPITGSCTASLCQNGGTCHSLGAQYICVCNSQWSGPICNVPNSINTTMTTTTTTTAAPGTDACSPNPCLNAGTCYKHGNGFVCVCASQFTGPTCAAVKTTTPAVPTLSPTKTCANAPCQNGGTCYNTGNSYFCYCGSGSKYTGNNCEIPTAIIATNCPLNCSPGQCISTGNSLSPYACMCNGAITPNKCSK